MKLKILACCRIQGCQIKRLRFPPGPYFWIKVLLNLALQRAEKRAKLRYVIPALIGQIQGNPATGIKVVGSGTRPVSVLCAVPIRIIFKDEIWPCLDLDQFQPIKSRYWLRDSCRKLSRLLFQSARLLRKLSAFRFSPHVESREL